MTICQGSFEYVRLIDTVNFSWNSQVKIIDKKAFSCSAIKVVNFPKSVTFIGEAAFQSCIQLNEFNFPFGSDLKIIEKNAFNGSNISSLTIPSSFIEFKNDWCKYAKELANINLLPSENPSLCLYNNEFFNDVFDVLLFAPRNIKRIRIPSFIKRISSCAFEYCIDLISVEFESDSQLEIMEENAFSVISIGSITIPSSVPRIEKSCFDKCSKLKRVDFLPGSRLVFNSFNLASINCERV